ncbi:MAG: DUF3667 domain-containing protein [Kangiellaceae bacterium]|nr:DUF3667 domain-containing protein [Kangiellaceae bacterium]
MEKILQCASCATDLQGAFCSQCGERQLDPELRKIRYLLGDFIEELTSLDGKFIKSFVNLIFIPGRNELNFHRGARVQYLKPITLFLLINIVFVALMPLSDFYVSFVDQKNQIYSPHLLEWIQSTVAASGLSEQVFESQYNQSVKLLARSIIIIGVPFLLPFIVLLFNHQRYFLSDHFVFALNLYGWWMLWMLISWWFSDAIAFLVLNIFEFDLNPGMIFGPIMPLGVVIYLFISIGRMYENSWLLTLLKIPIVLVGLAVSHLIFRYIQLILTMWTV